MRRTEVSSDSQLYLEHPAIYTLGMKGIGDAHLDLSIGEEKA